MQDFQLYITDSRYAGQTVQLIAVADARRAREVAAALLAEAPGYLTINIFTGGFQIPTLADDDRQSPDGEVDGQIPDNSGQFSDP
jgi:hypothetical protein